MRVVGYGIAGKGEASRYMRATLEEFKRLCDTTVIVLNNAGVEEYNLVKEFGFEIVEDNSEWGKDQWKIKQRLLDEHITPLSPDWCITLDMDETMPGFNREDIEEYSKYGDSFYVYIVNLWNDGYKYARCFWNIRIWKWTGDTEMKQSSLHCGLAPKWAYFVGVYVPVALLHFGLKKLSDRKKKIERYNKYDPDAKYIDRSYYDSLHDNTSDILNLEDIQKELNQQWSYSKPANKKTYMVKKEQEYFYLRRKSDGKLVDVPAEDLEETMARGGFINLGPAKKKKKVAKVEDKKAPDVACETTMTSCKDCGDFLCNKIHEDWVPFFPCDQCEKSFKTAPAAKAHVTRYHKEV